MDVRWKAELFGGLRVVHGDRVVAQFRRQKTGSLLAYLAYNRDRRHPREVLTELLWPDVDPEDGRHNLRQALSSLRHQLEPPGVSPGAVLVADRSFVALNPEAILTDVADFEGALKCAAREPVRDGRVLALATAVETYTGELLHGYYENWVVREQERLRGLFLDAAHRLIKHLEEDADFERALSYAHHAIAADPFLHEEAHRDVIRLLAATGKPEEALRHYRELERLLGAAPSRAPDIATRQLVAEIERITPVRPADAKPVVPATLPAMSFSAGMAAFLLVGAESAGERRSRPDALQTVRRESRRFGGREVKRAEGSSTFAFSRAKDGLTAAVAAHRALAALPLGPSEQPRVRMALHIGDVSPRKGGYPAGVLKRAAFILGAAHAGQILCSEEAAAVLRRAPDPDVRVADLGAYRLAPGDDPEHLFQVHYQGMAPENFPPPNADPPHAGHLPLQFTRFFGREEEIARLSEKVRAEGARLVTMTGTGGSGKTRLAIETSRRLLGPFQGAVWFVPLASLIDPRLVTHAVLDALALPRPSGAEPMDRIAEALAAQPSLLVLDNFEHLIEGGTGVVKTLLERVPSLTCLITSRHKLNLPGEREFPVHPLPTPDEGQRPEQLARNESVALFVDRAQAVRADFQVTERNAAALARLCSRLEGIPLALELAAARAPVVSVSGMLEQLEHRFDALVTRHAGADGRHGTLRAALDWSYRLLSPDLQHFFAKLSVFRGGWTAAAAEEVCVEPRTMDSLTQLLACSLVLSDDSADGMRFSMLETLREYGWEQLSEAERNEVRRRHANYFAGVAEDTDETFHQTLRREPLDTLELEHDNLRAAIAWAESGDGDAEVGLRTAIALARFWGFRNFRPEAARHFNALLALPVNTDRTELRAEGLRQVADTLRWDGHLGEAQACVEESLAISEANGSEVGVAGSLQILAVVIDLKGERAESRSLAERSLAMFHVLGQPRRVAVLRQLLSLHAVHFGDYAAAKEHCALGLDYFLSVGDRTGEGNIYIRLGQMARNQGEPALARSFFEKALAIRDDLGDRQGVAQLLNYIAHTMWLSDEMEAAWDTYVRSLRISREIRCTRAIAEALRGQANVLRCQGDFESARGLLVEAVSTFRDIGETDSVACALDLLGVVTRELGDTDGARALHMEAARMFLSMGSTLDSATSLERFAALAWEERDVARSARLSGSASAVREALSAPIPAPERAAHERCLAAVRESLGEDAFAAEWEAGRGTLSLDALAAIIQDPQGKNRRAEGQPLKRPESACQSHRSGFRRLGRA